MTAVAPAPGAMADGAAFRRVALAGPWSDLADTVPTLEGTASPFLGLVPELVELTYDVDDVRSFYAGANSAAATELIGHAANSANGGGAFRRDRARSAALGETIERYSAAFMPAERLVLGSAEDLGPAAVDPAACALFHARQHALPTFGFEPFTARTPVRWVDAVDLVRGTPSLLPSQMVFLNGRRAAGERPITYGTSNGLACGPTRREALASGLLELVERDALMITWHAGLSLPLIDLGSDDRVAALLARHFDAAGLWYAAVDLTEVLGIPTALGVVRNHHSDLGALALGAAARPDLGDAAVEALLEAFQTRTWCKSQQRQTPRIPDGVDLGAAVTTFDAHVRYYGERDRAAFADFLTASPERTDLGSAPRLPADSPLELVEAVLSRLVAHDVDVHAVDVTAPDVAEMGLSVVKVYSPQLQPLDVGWTTRFLGGRRLYEVPAELGRAPGPLDIDDLTPHPHPFP